ncbi:nucleotidyl transferase AbiEii/AbiGii toxin family protein [Patescibacteria group bacterium]|nr:nucleotidyl transferase AbiEii/AbiGii toxin family protein [Patescibacteria group bacterium]
MFRLLREILRNTFLANHLFFKGGTYAALRGVLDRFSIDLDFDLPNVEYKNKVRAECYKIFQKLNLEIKDESKNYLQFFLKYESKPNERNTLKLEINDEVNKANTYEKVHLLEINMFCNAQTLGTMFANKLIAAKARFEKNGKIAGRDFYDIHHFLLENMPINEQVIQEKTGLSLNQYMKMLSLFIKENLTQTALNEDLNPLMKSPQLRHVAQNLKLELLEFLKEY